MLDRTDLSPHRHGMTIPQVDTQQLAWSVGRWIGRGVLGLAVITFLLQWLLPRLRKWYRHHGSPSPPNVHAVGRSDSVSEAQRQKQEAIHRELQERHQAKAASYRERILQPREDAKKQQKEEEFYRFLGPAWKGKGQALGNDEDQRAEQEELDEFEKDLNPREMAAIRRRIQKPTPQPPQPPQKPKRVITLPEEPSEGDPDSVLVLLRSPIQTMYRRRFRLGDTVQLLKWRLERKYYNAQLMPSDTGCIMWLPVLRKERWGWGPLIFETLLDFMTVSGFTQTFNTLCTSYPRHDLAQDKDLTLQELGFTGRVTLNIEEKDL